LDSQGRPGGDYHGSLRGRAIVSPDSLKAILAGAPATAEQLHAAAEKGDPKGFEIPGTASIRTTTAHTSIRSANVLGLLRGSDPALANSYVVLTAHLDHVGIGRAVNGDTIYNGAFDNAMGSAILLEVARTLASSPQRPRRSVMFAFVTAEEKGLIGSDYFAHHPPGGRSAVVANLNLDMPLLQWPIADVVAFGAENSTLETTVRESLEANGLKLAPDPMPQEHLFVRSDQYSLVRQGVPAVFLMPAFGSKDPSKDGGQILQHFLATHYHQPSDDLKLPMDLSAVATFTKANYAIVLAIANDPVAPAWKEGNFFGELFGRGK
jgi:Zn-dependent M28 family amino/carboxypeptidase